jgi:large subunit ribosomal protein L5
MPEHDSIAKTKNQAQTGAKGRAKASAKPGVRLKGTSSRGAAASSKQRRQPAQDKEKSITEKVASPKIAVSASLPRLLKRYREEFRPSLLQEMGYVNIMEVPRLSKIVLNIGLGEALQNNKALENATAHLAAITGQKPVVTRARKSIASFKLRQGMSIGTRVTLRSGRMYDFFDRLVNVTLPRIRDFRGTPRNSFDGQGNYSLGLREQTMFPEIDYDQIDRIRGLQITIVTSAETDREAHRLLETLGMPFAREEQPA